MLGAELWCGANYHVAREDCLVGFFGRLDNILGASVWLGKVRKTNLVDLN